MSCPISKCPKAVRWQTTLCADHARKVPESMQYAVYRALADLKRSCRKSAVIETAVRYKTALRKAVEAVSLKEPA